MTMSVGTPEFPAINNRKCLLICKLHEQTSTVVYPFKQYSTLASKLVMHVAGLKRLSDSVSGIPDPA